MREITTLLELYKQVKSEYSDALQKFKDTGEYSYNAKPLQVLDIALNEIAELLGVNPLELYHLLDTHIKLQSTDNTE